MDEVIDVSILGLPLPMYGYTIFCGVQCKGVNDVFFIWINYVCLKVDFKPN